MVNKWRTRATTDGRGTILQASAAIIPGELILAEAPLCSLNVGLSDILDESRFWNKRDPHSGKNAFELMCTQMSNIQRRQFDNLTWKSRVGETNEDVMLSRLITNAFGDKDQDQSGHEYHVLRVYSSLSRANHSCRPNAMIKYNPAAGRGELRALVPLQPNDEITIKYLSTEDDSLQPRTQRRANLKVTWKFTCNCDACALAGRALTQDNTRRSNALTLYQGLKTPYGAGLNYAGMVAANNRIITNAQTYVRSLQDLEQYDTKLSNAFQLLASAHTTAFKLASGKTDLRTQEDLQHCQDCRTDRSPHAHLDKALQALMDEYAQDVLTCGVGHEQLTNVQDRMNELQAWKLQYLHRR